MAASRTISVRLTVEEAAGAKAALEQFKQTGESAAAGVGQAFQATGSMGDGLEAALTKVNAALARTSGASTATEAQANKMRDALNRLAASASPLEDAFQKAERAEKLLADAQTRGIKVTEEQVRGVESLRAAYQRLAVQYQAPAQGFVQAGTQQVAALRDIVTANDNAGGSANRLASQVQNASFQIGDFSVQVASGQSAVTALAQQLPQLLGGFGIVGAISGAAVAIGAMAYRFLEGEDAAKKFSAAIEAQSNLYDTAQAAADRRLDGLTKEAEAVNRLRDYYTGLTAEQQRGERANLEAARRGLADTGFNLTQSIGGDVRSRVANAPAGDGLSGYSESFSAGAVTDDMRRVVAILDTLNDPLNRTREGIAGVIGQLAPFAQGTSATAREIAALADEVRKIAPDLEKNGDALAQNRAQMEALGGAAPGASQGISTVGGAARSASAPVDDLSTALGRAAAALRELQRQALDNPFQSIERRVETLQAQANAIARGSIAQSDAIGQRDALRTRQEQERNQLLDEQVKNINEAAKAEAARASTAEEAAAILRRGEEDGARARELSVARIAQLQGQEGRLSEAIRTGTEAIKEREAASRKAEAAAESAGRKAENEAKRRAAADEREAQRVNALIYDTPRRDRSGLETLTASDDNAIRAAIARLRSSGLDPEAARKATDALKKAEEDGQRSFTRLSQRFGDAVADDLARGIVEGGRNGADTMADTLARTLRSVATRGVSELLNATALQPLGNAALSALGIRGGSVIGPDGKPTGGLVNSSGQAIDLASLRNVFSGAPVNTGIGGLDRTLNTSFLGSTVGGYVGGIGSGFAAGGVTNGLLGGSSKGGAIGSATGAVAGAVIGSVIPVIGTALGGLIGGAAGGALGGLFGKPGFSGGTIQVEIQDGQLVVAGTRAKGSADNSEAVKALTEATKGLNDALTSRGLRLSGGGLVTEQGFGQDKRAADLEGVARNYLTADDPAIRAAISNSLGGSLEAVLADVDFVRQTFNPLVAAYKDSTSGASEFSKALEAQTAPLQAAIEKAKGLGLGVSDLAASLERTTRSAYDARDATVQGIRDNLYQEGLTARGDNSLAAQNQVANLNGQIRVAALDSQLRSLGYTPGEANGNFAEVNTLLQILADGQVTRERGFNIQMAANNNRLQDRFDAATGYGSTLEGALAKFERDAAAERASVANESAETIKRTEDTLAQERLGIIKRYADQAADIDKQSNLTALTAQRDAIATLRGYISTLTSFQDNQAVAGPGVTAQNAFLAAQQQYGTAVSALQAGGNDYAGYTSAASTFSSAINSYLGAGAEGSGFQNAIREQTRGLLGQLGNQADATINGFVQANVPVVDAVTQMRDVLQNEISELRRDLRMDRIDRAA